MFLLLCLVQPSDPSTADSDAIKSCQCDHETRECISTPVSIESNVFLCLSFNTETGLKFSGVDRLVVMQDKTGLQMRAINDNLSNAETYVFVQHPSKSVLIQTRLMSSFYTNEPLEKVFVSGNARVTSSSTLKTGFTSGRERDREHEGAFTIHPFQVELSLTDARADLNAAASIRDSPSSSSSILAKNVTMWTVLASIVHICSSVSIMI
jgi:hypothetical protein